MNYVARQARGAWEAYLEEKYGELSRNFIRDHFRVHGKITVSDVEGNLYHDANGWSIDDEIVAHPREHVEAVADEEEDEEVPLPQPKYAHAETFGHASYTRGLDNRTTS